MSNHSTRITFPTLPTENSRLKGRENPGSSRSASSPKPPLSIHRILAGVGFLLGVASLPPVESVFLVDPCASPYSPTNRSIRHPAEAPPRPFISCPNSSVAATRSTSSAHAFPMQPRSNARSASNFTDSRDGPWDATRPSERPSISPIPLRWKS